MSSKGKFLFTILVVIGLPISKAVTTSPPFNPCIAVTILETEIECIAQDIHCNEDGVLQIYVYEDCPEGILVIQVEEPDVDIDDCEQRLIVDSEKQQFGFLIVNDADNPSFNDGNICLPGITTKDGISYELYIISVNSNEFNPQPYNISTVQSIYVDENSEGLVYEFGYIDPDVGEITTLEFDFTEDSDGFFSLVEEDLVDDVQVYGLLANDNLDFEANSFYNLEIVFTSIDVRNKNSSTIQTFYFFVQDKGDNPPIFTSPCLYLSVDEEAMNEPLCTVVAKDEDVVVNNDILYSLASVTPEYGEDFFMINETTGEIKTSATQIIDREMLESTSFSLQIYATEILKDGTVAPDPNLSTQITNIYIDDVNDNIPEFDRPLYEEEMEEFDQEKSQITDTKSLGNLTITITDLDEGNAGKYTITTDNDEFIRLNPTEGVGITEVYVTVVFNDKLDYEKYSNETEIIVVKITVTETEDPSHKSTSELHIQLIDINDNTPIFNETNYVNDCEENASPGTVITTIYAQDFDSSDDFNQISYFISGGSDALQIDSFTGQITVTEGADLDYELQDEINCEITASDGNENNVNSLESKIPLVLHLIDINDVTPSFVDFSSEENVFENVTLGYVVATITVIDQDTSADIEVDLSYSEDQEIDVKNWFSLEILDNSTKNHYMGNLIVNDQLDREVSGLVTINIIAKDINATETQQQQETMMVTILDINDEDPIFDENYSEANYDENTSKNTVILIIKASDPDENDQIFYSISENPYLKISDESSGNISVKSVINREEVDKFTVTVTIKDLKNNFNEVEIEFSINDLNDNNPDFGDSCSGNASVSEDASDGQVVSNVTATDDDSGIHAEITYVIANQNNIGSPDQYAPFAIDSVSGVISVDNSSGLLDRELRPQWVLTVQAVDGCKADEIADCTVNYAVCYITVDVLDVNDEKPEQFALNNGDTIITNEDLLENEKIADLQISATDLDEEGTKNSEIEFEATALFYQNGTELQQMFQTVNSNLNQNYFCELKAKENLTHLRGQYVITIKAIDQGPNAQPSYENFSLTIEDTNDWAPEVTFSECLEGNDQLITIIENDTPRDTPLNCSLNQEELALIIATDKDDPSSDNSKVLMRIDPDNSFCLDGLQDNQVEDFQIVQMPDEDQLFSIQIRRSINRERGSIYNLSILAYDLGTPVSLDYSFMIYVNVEDQNEFPAIFCDVNECNQQISILENSMDSVTFQVATDADNVAANNDPVNNDVIYYSINDSDGTENAFWIPDPQINIMKPLYPLDREEKSSYAISILASNGLDENVTQEFQSNQLLNVIVVVLDENDNIPSYGDTLYGAYYSAGLEGQLVAIVEFTDEDLNDTLTYTLGDDFVWIPEQNIKEPFRIERIDDRRSQIILNTDPVTTNGQCSFTIYCNDLNPDHDGFASAEVEVFVITDEFLVPFYFQNDIVTVQANSQQVEDILSDVFGYKSQIDSIYESKDSSNTQGETTVLAHFIDIIEEKESDNEIIRTNEMQNSISELYPKSFKSAIETRTIDIKSETFQDHRDSLSLSSYSGNRKISNMKELNQLETRSRIKEPENIESSQKTKLEILEKDQNGPSSEQKMRTPVPVNEFGATSSTSKLVLTTDFKNKEVQYELVPGDQIEELGTNGQIASELIEQFDAIGLNIVQIGDSVTVEDNHFQKTIISLEIAIGVISLILGLLLLLMTIGYLHKTNKLKRQLKVLSAKDFGSKSSELQNAGVPGSNLYTGHQSNPVYNLEEANPTKNIIDNLSISSGDSDLIGIEDNPEFYKYIESRRKLYEIEETADSINELAANDGNAASTVSGSDSLDYPEKQIKFTSSPFLALGELDDVAISETTSEDNYINSNFSFS